MNTLSNPAQALIDLRLTEAFERNHHQQAASIPLPQLFERMHELPPRHVPLTLIIEPSQQPQAAAFFQQKNIHVTQWRHWNEAYARQLAHEGVLRQGKSDQRYWQASEVVQQFVEHVMTAPNSHPNRLQALDIGCGAGRDSVVLAQAGYHITAIDHNPDALVRCQRLAAVNRLGDAVHTQSLALTQPQALNQFADHSVDLIVVARYLHRPLFACFQRLIRPSGYLLYQTFTQGCETRGGPKNPQFILQADELATAFGNQRIVHDEAINLPDGRPMRVFVAQWR